MWNSANEMAYALAALMFLTMGVAYVKGYDMVKSRSPEHLPHFYLAMATIRMLLVLTAVGIYVLLANDRNDTITFALTCLGMYVATMIVTLTLRH